MTKQQRTVIVVFTVLAAAALLLWLSLRSRHSGPDSSQRSTTSDFHGTPPEGTGGDPGLNRHKNRWAEPTAYQPMTVEQIKNFEHGALDDAGRKLRSNWSSAALEQAKQYEDRGVQVEGYLVAAKQSGPESCNGESNTYRDDHLWLASAPDDQKRDALVVEVTPFWNERNPQWDLRSIMALVRQHIKVRISGWVLWDEEHADEVGKSRGSQWEIHPITRIEINDNGTWEPLSGTAAL